MNSSIFCSIKDLLADILEVLQQPDVEYDFELVCNAETGVYDLYGQTITDGVPSGVPVVTPTTISCIPEPIPVVTADIEYFCDEDLDTWHFTVTTFIDGVLDNVAAAVDTGVSCDDPEPDVVEVDFEVLCNEETGFWEYHTVVTTNGVSAPVVVEATTVVCSPEPPVDVESVRVCDEATNTIHVVTTIYDGITGAEISVLSDVDTGELCACRGQVDCVESQEWTYGIDNTGTNYRWLDATYQITLSDGSTLQWDQTTASNGGWSAQLTEWSANIQATADAAGLAWFVEPRYVDSGPSGDPTSLDGTINGPGGTPSGLPGAPSVPVAEALIAGGMSYRYVNIQICPGQPVPVSAEIVEVVDPGVVATREPGYPLTTAGAVLGPIQKFFVCRCCGEEPLWYLEDSVTLADAGQVPNCWEPCGTLALTEAPPDRACDFVFDTACDNVGQTDQANFVTEVTRRATVCNGERIAVSYFVPDPNDPAALTDYELVGQFVDCDSGEVLPSPEIECAVADIVICEDPCKYVSVYINGRPPASLPWVWGPYSGDNLNDFEASMEADGRTVYLYGEKHAVCPPIDAELFVDGESAGVPPLEPNPVPEDVEPDQCAELVSGCNDDRRDESLESIIDKLCLLADALTCEHLCARTNFGERTIGQGANFTLGDVTGATWDDFVINLANTGVTVDRNTIYNAQGLPAADVTELVFCYPADATPATELSWDTFLPGSVTLVYEANTAACCTICEQEAADAAADGIDCVMTTSVVDWVPAADGCQTLPAGARYTIFVTSEEFTFNGAPIPCGTVLNVPECCGCITDAPVDICVPAGEPGPTIIREVKTAIVKGTVKEATIKEAVKSVRTTTTKSETKG